MQVLSVLVPTLLIGCAGHAAWRGYCYAGAIGAFVERGLGRSRAFRIGMMLSLSLHLLGLALSTAGGVGLALAWMGRAA